MFSGQSLFGILAAVAYGLALLACGYASVSAAKARLPQAHIRNWSLIALLFAGLIVLRAFDIEDSLRESFRAWLRDEGIYQDRRAYQRPMVAVLIAIAAPLLFFLIYRIAHYRSALGSIAINAAIFASFVMLGVLGLRVISLHQIDGLLYGPLKLNWFADIGSSMVVIGTAILYVWELKRSR